MFNWAIIIAFITCVIVSKPDRDDFIQEFKKLKLNPFRGIW